MNDLERCPGCGNVIVRDGDGKVEGRNYCFPFDDRGKPGYGYLEKTWGYCYTLSRHYGLDEPVVQVNAGK